MTNVLIINEDIAGEKPKAYFNANDIPTVPPSPKLDSNINEFTAIALTNAPIKHTIIFLVWF